MHTGTLHEALDLVASRNPDTPVDFPSEHASIGCGDLALSSRLMAGGLLERGVTPGARVGILSQNAPEFLQALFAAGRAGTAACPLPLPGGTRDLAGYAARLKTITAVADIRTVIVSARLVPLARRFAGALDGVNLMNATDLSGDARSLPGPDLAGGDDLAIVQFTSGSTAAPKGVTLTHRNVLAGIASIVDGIALGPGDGGGSWLPLFHDMGLFATLSAILTSVSMTVWSPASFVRDPARWLREFLARDATISPAPNFGYDALTAAVPAAEAAGLDMRRWRVALNGAEPVSVDSVERFLDRFAPAGFAAAAMFPVYGMAEATLAVTFPPLGRAPVTRWFDREQLAGTAVVREVPRDHPRARGVVGCGRPVRGIQLRIASDSVAEGDNHGGTVSGAEGRIGEILIRGDPVTSGYLATTAGGIDAFTDDGWLRTGDLGFRLGEEVFVTGRRKEMIIVRGVNFYPDDVESLARDQPGVFRRRCVAFTDRDHNGDEIITLLAETNIDDPAARERLRVELRNAVTGGLGLSDISVRLLPPSSLPRTSSGKFQRLAAREMPAQDVPAQAAVSAS